MQGVVVRAVNHAKPAHPQQAQHFKLIQPRARRQGIDMDDWRLKEFRGLLAGIDHDEGFLHMSPNWAKKQHRINKTMAGKFCSPGSLP